MGFFKPTAFISGLARGGLDLFDNDYAQTINQLEGTK